MEDEPEQVATITTSPAPVYPAPRNGRLEEADEDALDDDEDDSDEDEQEEDDDDRLEVASVVLPPRMPSKREAPNRGDKEDDLEDVALTSTYSQSLYSQ